MADADTRPRRKPDPATRTAALWATVVAVPVAILVGVLAFTRLAPGGDTAARTAPGDDAGARPAASAPVVVPDTPVPMAAPRLSAGATQVCRAVTAKLPKAVRNLPAREVSAGPAQNAAYGEPPLTVACGVEQPPMCETLDGGPDCVPLDSELLIMNQVCWYAKQTPDKAIFTTMDREVAVQVTVPMVYRQPAQWANEFSDIVTATNNPRTNGAPTGCG